MLDKRLRFNSSIFHIDFEDQQVASFEAGTGGATSVIFNAGKSTISGIEVELTAQLTEALRLNLNLGHIDSEYDEFISGRTDPVSGFPAPNVTSPSFNAATGEEDISDTAIFPTSPENTASVVLSYDFLGVSWADVNARLEMTYRDSMVFHPINVLYDKTEDQTLINARVTFSELAMADEKLTIAGVGSKPN